MHLKHLRRRWCLVLPPDAQRLAKLHRTRQQTLAALAVTEARRLWARLSPANFSTTWNRVVGPAVLTAVTSAQFEASRGAQEYVAAQVVMQGGVADPAGLLLQAAFSGVASDGRPLNSLLASPMFDVRAFVDGGMPVRKALDVGERHLARIVATQVQDAARVSTGVAIANDRKVKGYVRVLTPPSCSRCTILAGRWYRYDAGFPRHPECDCSAAPATEHLNPQSPLALYNEMSPDERKKAGWSQADQKAIADGGDLYQVTNARRDLKSVSIAGHTIQTTQHGATRRGLAGTRLQAGKGKRAIRLTPEAIYSEAERLGWSRDEILRQLKRHGYIL